jgi:hypothetical protein
VPLVFERPPLQANDWLWLTCAVLSTFLMSCGGSQTAKAARAGSEAPPAAPTFAAPATAFPDRDWGRAVLPRAALALVLPDRPAWKRVKSSGWERLAHAPSGSRLELHLSRAERLARPETCEATARIERPDLPRFGNEEALDHRTLEAPAEFRTQVTVGIIEVSPSEVEAHVLAFGAAVGRCLAVHFVTRTTGAGVAEEAARRLGLVVDRVLPSLTVATVEDRVEPEPFDPKAP